MQASYDGIFNPGFRNNSHLPAFLQLTGDYAWWLKKEKLAAMISDIMSGLNH
jgi:hypothetical protein